MRISARWIGVACAAVVFGWCTPDDFARAATTPATAKSSTYAGYASATVSQPATLNSKFTVPRLSKKCSSHKTGIGISTWLNPSGGAPTGATIEVECGDRMAFYSAFAIVNGSSTYLQDIFPSFKHVIKVSVTESTTSSSVTVTDNTFGASQTVIGAGASNSGYLVGMTQELTRSGSPLPVPHFTTLHYKSVTLNGAGLTDATRYDYRSGSDVQIMTGPLALNGRNFTETFEHAT